jgi:hypothetical protein
MKTLISDLIEIKLIWRRKLQTVGWTDGRVLLVMSLLANYPSRLTGNSNVVFKGTHLIETFDNAAHKFENHFSDLRFNSVQGVRSPW